MMTAGLYLHTIIFAFLLRPNHNGDVTDKPKDFENLELHIKQEMKKKLQKKCTQDVHLLRNPKFALFLVHTVLVSIGFAIIFVHMGAFTITKGISEDKAAILYSMLGVGSTTARSLSGLLAQVKCIGPKKLHFTGISLLGTTTLLFPLGKTYLMFGASATCIGIFHAANGGLPVVITVELVGVDNLATAFGYVSIACGIGSVLGGPFSGEFYSSFASLQINAAKYSCLFRKNHMIIELKN